jgi:hypothetical protein
MNSVLISMIITLVVALSIFVFWYFVMGYGYCEKCKRYVRIRIDTKTHVNRWFETVWTRRVYGAQCAHVIGFNSWYNHNPYPNAEVW